MASFSISCPKSSALLPVGSRPHGSQQQQTFWKISFPASRLRSSFLAGFSLDQSPFFRFQWPGQNHSALWKVHGLQHEVAAEKSSNSAPVPKAKMEVPLSGGKDDQTEEPPLQNAVPDPASISAFMAQVADLVKLVDSKDIMELQLKQLDCELIIRKKAALPQTPIGPPFVMMQQPPPQVILPSQPQPVQATAPAPSAPVQAVSAPASKSSHQPLKCPMAGTFYRSSAPGEPPFVKVGDKVQKGQVLCIIEAMKLMNEIEADQSGTIVEILVEDGKPVSVDMPLFSIEP